MSRYADVLNGTFGDEPTTSPGRNSSTIFGTGARLMDDSDGRAQRRLVIYPCESAPADFEVAQGLMTVLAWAVHSLDGVVVLPLLSASPTESSSKFFTPESFSLEGLGEDTVFTASLKRESDVYLLDILAETELENVDDLKYTVLGQSLPELASALVHSLNKIAAWLDGSATETDTLPSITGENGEILDWLLGAYKLHLALIRDAVNGAAFDFEQGQESPFFAPLTELINHVSATQNPMLNWLLLQGMALSSVWFEEIDPEGFATRMMTVKNWQIGASALARALVDMSETALALNVLENAVSDAPEIPFNWLVLARFYGAARRPDLQLNTIKSGLEQHDSYAPLLMFYGETSLNYANQGISHGHSIQAEPLKNGMAGEAQAAFDAAIERTQGDARNTAYIQLITARTLIPGANIWGALAELAEADATGTYTEHAISAASAQDDIEQALPGLIAAAEKYPEAGQVWRNLAYVQYLTGDNESAAASVQKAISYTSNVRVQGEYEILGLYTQDARLEAQIADIAERINAGTPASDRDLELLEWVAAEAPHYGEIYLLLSRAYRLEDEADTALEVLLDAEQHVGIDADVIVAIVDLLQEAEEDAVALDYVSKGLEAYPRNIRLLARAAQVAFTLGDDEGASAFLRQAHNIAPYHRELLRVTKDIMDSED